MIYNVQFDPALLEYDDSYDNSLRFSATFRDYAEGLAHRLIDTYDLRNSDIVEIGSGDGHFLKLLSELGGNRCVGFDPSYRADNTTPTGETVSIIPDLYREDYAEYPADLICFRHVLEHMAAPRDLLSSLRRIVGSRGTPVLYCEVPDARAVLDTSLWDVIYPHCSYFTPVALRRVFLESGYEIFGLGTAYGGQFLYIEAAARAGARVSAEEARVELEEVARLVARSKKHFRDCVERWSSHLDRLCAAGNRIVLWGAGAKGVTFLNVVPAGRTLQAVVDLNPRKQGMYVPGTGQAIVAPQELTRLRPDVVVLLNPLYKAEVQAGLDQMGLAAEVLTEPFSTRGATV